MTVLLTFCLDSFYFSSMIIMVNTSKTILNKSEEIFSLFLILEEIP